MEPTAYTITVRGEMTERLAAAFAPLACRCDDGRTVIEGRVLDQSQLFGVLQQIRDLGIELIALAPAAPADAVRHDTERTVTA